jgi:hypothetical protein
MPGLRDWHPTQRLRRRVTFGEAVNRDLEHEPIRIQEISDTDISGDLSREGPACGRRYEIFYNQVKIGLLQIKASYHRHFDKQDN